MRKIAKAVRIVTVPPVLALVLIITVFLRDPALMGNPAQYLAFLFFIVIVPILAYPMQRFTPRYKTRGRQGQRELAFVLAAAGYIGGVVFSLATKATVMAHVIYWTYFISVLLLTLFNRLTPWRASGHACGVAGPIALALYLIGARALPLLLVFAAVIWSSVVLKRHTAAELVLGGLCSVTAFVIVLACQYLIFVSGA
jgi:hypothetical protein